MRWTQDVVEVERALLLRERVFCGEQGVPPAMERDGRDGEALHLLALDAASGELVGTLRVLLAGSDAKIGRVVVEREWRGRGIAARMLAEALAMAGARGCERARLAAQVRARSLYEGAGFAVCSEPFDEVGIAHVWMQRPLGGG
jgi:predicted GNAT family N-acyltransferase